MNRYQIITYDPNCGTDEKLEYKTIKEAKKAVIEYLKDYKGAFIYDIKTKSVKHAFNEFPDDHFSLNVSIENCKLHFKTEHLIFKDNFWRSICY